MSTSVPVWLQHLLPAQSSISLAERLRSSIGALIGILLTGLLSIALLGSVSDAVWLIAPMGASAVLLFAVPASPMAQPWSIIGGNLIAAAIGVACARYLAPVALAAAAAVALSIAAMFVLRCLHPPGGAVALTAVVGGASVHASGYGFILSPVLLNSVLLLLTALVYNRLVGRRYPHSQRIETHHPHQTADVAPSARLGFRAEDLQAVLRDYNQVVDVSVDELEAIFQRTEQHAFRRRFGDTRCRDIMSKDIVSVEFATELTDAWQLMQRHGLQALPVIDRARRVIGVVSRADFLAHADPLRYEGLGERLRAFMRHTPLLHSDKPEVVGQIMSAPATTATGNSPIVELVPLMSDIGLHHVPIVDEQKKLVGMVTQTDLVAALYETSLAELSAA